MAIRNLPTVAMEAAKQFELVVTFASEVKRGNMPNLGASGLIASGEQLTGPIGPGAVGTERTL